LIIGILIIISLLPIYSILLKSNTPASFNHQYTEVFFLWVYVRDYSSKRNSRRRNLAGTVKRIFSLIDILNMITRRRKKPGDKSPIEYAYYYCCHHRHRHYLTLFSITASRLMQSYGFSWYTFVKEQNQYRCYTASRFDY